MGRPLLSTRTALGSAGLIGLAALGAFFGVQCTDRQPSTPADAVHAQGARLYRTYCALCHGEEGQGYAADAANALTNQDFLVSISDAFLKTAIRRGHPGTAMPAYARIYRGPLEDAEIDAIVAFIRSFQREPSAVLQNRPIEGDATRAAPLYAARCAGCHGDRGQGVTALSLDNPVFHENASDGQIRYAIERGRRGSPMPGFARELTPAQLDDLVALVRSFRRDRPAPRQTADVPDAADMPLVIHPDGPAPRFSLREGRFVSSRDLARALEQGKRVVVLDARPPSDWTSLRIPGAVPAPYYAVDSIVERLPRDDTFIIAYCACPHAASGRVVDTLRERGFEHTAVLDEGILVWRDLGYPVEGTSVEQQQGGSSP